MDASSAEVESSMQVRRGSNRRRKFLNRMSAQNPGIIGTGAHFIKVPVIPNLIKFHKSFVDDLHKSFGDVPIIPGVLGRHVLGLIKFAPGPDYCRILQILSKQAHVGQNPGNNWDPAQI